MDIQQNNKRLRREGEEIISSIDDFMDELIPY